MAKGDEDDDETQGEGAESTEQPKKGLVGKILGFTKFLNPLAILKLPMKQKIIAVAALLLVIGGGAGAIMFLGGKPADKIAAADGKSEAPKDLPPLQAVFFDMPDVIVNIQGADGATAYLKLAVALELGSPQEKQAVDPLLPRVVDQFQTYLRELRIDDIRGSAGVMRLKEELLRRVNLAVSPTKVRDVLLKEMIVQ